MNIKISTILKELRRAKDVKQEDVANAIGISKSGYGYYEQGRSLPDPEMLLKLANYFDVSIDYLLGNSDDRTAPNSKKDTSAEKISSSLNDDPELSEFWNSLKDREDLQLLFKQTKNLSPNDVKKIIRVIKAIEDEEDRNDG